MDTLDTKLKIVDALISFCNEVSLDKISISDIVRRTGVNRKTFYYHFEDKDDLIRWVFRYDLGRLLEKRFSQDSLIYESKSTDEKTRFPYYVTNKVGVRSLDQSGFYECFAKVITRRRKLYAQALMENSPSSLRNYLYDLYVPAMKLDIGIILANRYLPKENIDFLAEFYTCAWLYFFIRRCGQKPIRRLLDNAGPFANIIHHSLETEIREAQLKRSL
jgi:AcrR family transcriptional regulator